MGDPDKPTRITTYAAFWPYYLREHAKPRTRALHYLGTALMLACGVALVATGNGWFALAMPLAGYGFAWAAHFLVEHNRPATFSYPVWSLVSDLKMWGLWITGGLGRELAAAGVE